MQLLFLDVKLKSAGLWLRQLKIKKTRLEKLWQILKMRLLYCIKFLSRVQVSVLVRIIKSVSFLKDKKNLLEKLVDQISDLAGIVPLTRSWQLKIFNWWTLSNKLWFTIKISKLESDLLKEKEFVAKLQNNIAEYD